MISKYGKSAFVQIAIVFEHACCVSKGPLRPDLLDIYLATFSGVRNLGKKLALRVIYFLKVFLI